MEERATKEKDKLESHTVKRKLELEGFTSDLQNLKKRMIFYQNYIGKLKKLVDRDQQQHGGPLQDENGNDMDIFGQD